MCPTRASGDQIQHRIQESQTGPQDGYYRDTADRQFISGGFRQGRGHFRFPQGQIPGHFEQQQLGNFVQQAPEVPGLGLFLSRKWVIFFL